MKKVVIKGCEILVTKLIEKSCDMVGKTLKLLYTKARKKLICDSNSNNTNGIPNTNGNSNTANPDPVINHPAHDTSDTKIINNYISFNTYFITNNTNGIPNTNNTNGIPNTNNTN
eukprot:Tbor_TRINITY_DN6181_c1_g3::TRINITY_DN6181_c1_g3_i1::g.22358::m.22358